MACNLSKEEQFTAEASTHCRQEKADFQNQVKKKRKTPLYVEGQREISTGCQPAGSEGGLGHQTKGSGVLLALEKKKQTSPGSDPQKGGRVPCTHQEGNAGDLSDDNGDSR